MPLIQTWQCTATFSAEVAWVGCMIIEDANRLLALHTAIKALEATLTHLSTTSEVAKRIDSIIGFGTVSTAELAGEIGTLARFKNEASLALYLGMAVLSNSSGNYRGVKASSQINTRAKRAMMVAVARHINLNATSKQYYLKKRIEGKRHNQAVRSLGRHLARVIWSLIKHGQDYKIRV